MPIGGSDSDAWRTAFSGPVLRRSFAVMLAVGSILNGINQGDALLAGAAVSWGKLLLTFCVPFLVSTYGAFSAARLASSRPAPQTRS